MPVRLLAGFALWLALAALPVDHLGVSTPLALAALAPLPLLAARRTAVLFVAGFLPLYAIGPDLVSPRTHGTVGVLAGAALLAGYLVAALREPGPHRPRSSGRSHQPLGTLLIAMAAVMCAHALAVPFSGAVAASVRQGYPTDPGPATVLVALGALALNTGLVLTYVAAPLDELARSRT